MTGIYPHRQVFHLGKYWFILSSNPFLVATSFTSSFYTELECVDFGRLELVLLEKKATSLTTTPTQQTKRKKLLSEQKPERFEFKNTVQFLR